MLSYLLPLLVAILAWLGLRLTGHETHAADGIIFFGLVAVELLVVVLNNRKPKPPTSAYNLLPLLICLPEWRWVVLVLLVVASVVAVAYGLYYALRKLYGAWPG